MGYDWVSVLCQISGNSIALVMARKVQNATNDNDFATVLLIDSRKSSEGPVRDVILNDEQLER